MPFQCTRLSLIIVWAMLIRASATFTVVQGSWITRMRCMSLSQSTRMTCPRGVFSNLRPTTFGVLMAVPSVTRGNHCPYCCILRLKQLSQGDRALWAWLDAVNNVAGHGIVRPADKLQVLGQVFVIEPLQHAFCFHWITQPCVHACRSRQTFSL